MYHHVRYVIEPFQAQHCSVIVMCICSRQCNTAISLMKMKIPRMFFSAIITSMLIACYFTFSALKKKKEQFCFGPIEVR